MNLTETSVLYLHLSLFIYFLRTHKHGQLFDFILAHIQYTLFLCTAVSFNVICALLHILTL